MDQLMVKFSINCKTRRILACQTFVHHLRGHQVNLGLEQSFLLSPVDWVIVRLVQHNYCDTDKVHGRINLVYEGKIMKDEYDLSTMKARKDSYASKLKKCKPFNKVIKENKDKNTDKG